jgi:sugar phosphate isomerase/epimerase
MNRREFAGSSARIIASAAVSAAAAAGTNRGSAAVQAAPRELRLGTVTYNLARAWDLDTLIKNCAETKFEGVELRTTHAHGVEISLTPEKRLEILKRFADSPVRLVGLGTTCEYHSPDAAIVKKNVEETKAWVLLARDIGAEGVKVRPNGLAAAVPEEKTLEQIGRALRECAVFGAEHGIPIRLEIHGRDTARIPRIRKILDHADHANLWACWNCNGEDLLDGGIEANFALVKSRLGLVHLKDLYDEDYPYRKLIQLLQGIDYSGYSLAEIPESTDPIRVMRYLRALFRVYQGL